MVFSENFEENIFKILVNLIIFFPVSILLNNHFFKAENAGRHLKFAQDCSPSDINDVFPSYQPVAPTRKVATKSHILCVRTGHYEVHKYINNKKITFRMVYNEDPEMRRLDHLNFESEKK